MDKWKEQLGDEYCLLVRAHYAVSVAMRMNMDGFAIDVSAYPYLNDLYAIADVLISDYSSSFIDFSILDKPMLCFAYDEREYVRKRGLYIDIHKELPCPVERNEDGVLSRILDMDYEQESRATKGFHAKYAPYAGNASKRIVDVLIKRLNR